MAIAFCNPIGLEHAGHFTRQSANVPAAIRNMPTGLTSPLPKIAQAPMRIPSMNGAIAHRVRRFK
jgi:hypothetical protein